MKSKVFVPEKDFIALKFRHLLCWYFHSIILHTSISGGGYTTCMQYSNVNGVSVETREKAVVSEEKHKNLKSQLRRILFLAYFPEVGLCDLHDVCVYLPRQLLNGRTRRTVCPQSPFGVLKNCGAQTN
jgi:hypothetical protein